MKVNQWWIPYWAHVMCQAQVSAVEWSESAVCIHILPPPLASLSPHIPCLWVITELWDELPVLCSSFPLDSYFTHGRVYMSSCSTLPFPSMSTSLPSTSARQWLSWPALTGLKSQLCCICLLSQEKKRVMCMSHVQTLTCVKAFEESDL